jgi:uncharacterized lipoprotein YbaY
LGTTSNQRGKQQNTRLGPLLRTLLGVTGLLVLSACGGPAEDAAVIRGTVTSREPVTLPPAAVLELRLERSAEGSEPPELLAVQRQNNPGRLPLQFTLEYEPTAVNPQRNYGISARVVLADDVLLATSRPVPVLTGDASESVSIELAPVGVEDAAADARAVITGRLDLGDTSATFRATIAGDAVEHIDEEFDLGDYGDGRASYDFEGARLTGYQESSKKRLVDPAKPEALVEISTTLDFDANGELVRSTKTMDGAPVEVSAADVASARNRADLLRNRVLAQYAGESHRLPHQSP